MSRCSNQKLKLLYLSKIFIENTDAAHPITVGEIIAELAKYEISSERKSLYDDIERLRVFGLDICVQRGRSVGYYLGKRNFELAELKLLADAVSASRFITEKKSEALIKKTEGLSGKHGAAQLRKQAHVCRAPKTENEEIFCNVDIISRAIAENRRVCFRYFSWDVNKRRVLADGGEFYCISPWALVWYGGEYYTIGYDDNNREIVPFRVDKMLEPFLDKRAREGEKAFASWNDSGYARQPFGLCGEGLMGVRLSCDVSIADEIIDMFGKDIVIAKGEERFEFTAKVMLGREFYCWLLGNAPLVRVVSPDPVTKKIEELISAL